jgi:hypothetical protein
LFAVFEQDVLGLSPSRVEMPLVAAIARVERLNRRFRKLWDFSSALMALPLSEATVILPQSVKDVTFPIQAIETIVSSS